MADPRGFLTTPRQLPARRPVDIRISDWREVYAEFGTDQLGRRPAGAWTAASRSAIPAARWAT